VKDTLRFFSLWIVAILIMCGARAEALPSMSYHFELSKKEYLGRESISYPTLTLIGTKVSQTEVPNDVVKVGVKYIGKFDREVGSGSFRILLRNCRAAQLGAPCGRSIPDLNAHLFKVTCNIHFRIGSETKSVRWGDCQESSVNADSAEVKPTAEVDSDDNLRLSFENIGKDESRPHRILIVYVNNEGEEISYTVRNVDRIPVASSVILQIPASYLYAYTCNLKLVLDPDYTSFAKDRDDHFMVVKYGECVDEPFVPYLDLAIGNANISQIGEYLKIDFEVSNEGDLPVTGRALEVVLQGLDQSHKIILKERTDIGGHLGPKENSTAQVMISKAFSNRICRFSIEVNSTSSLNESNQKNNKYFINYCNSRRGNVSFDQ